MYDKYSDKFGEVYPDTFLFDRLTWNQKNANDKEWAKRCAKYVDSQYSCYGDTNNLKRIEMNYRLANGKGEKEMQELGRSMGPNVLSEFGFTDQDIYGNIQHHPVIQQVYNAMAGEQQLRPLTPVALDVSLFSTNQRKRRRLELSQEYIRQQIIAPIQETTKQKVMQAYMDKYGVNDPYALSPQDQQQMESDIMNQTQAMTPKEIQEYMRKDYKSPGGMQAQKILDFVMSDLDIKFVTDENFKNLLIAGKEIYRIGVRNGRSFVEQVNPMGFHHVARPNAQFIEDGTAWKYEQFIMFSDLYTWHSEEIGNSTKLRDKIGLIGGQGRKFGEPNPQFVVEVNRNPDLLKTIPNIMTNEGQQHLASVFGNMGKPHRGQVGELRYTHTAWVSLRKMKNILRYNYDKDKTKSVWVDESYTFNPVRADENGYRDVEESICWAPDIWQATIAENDIFLDVGPYKHQYKSLNNPFLVKGPYVGGYYSKLMDNTEHVAPIDPAKPWQYKFNLQMARIHELEATDFGKVLSTTLQAKPEEWTYKQWFQMMKYGKMAITDVTSESWTPEAAQIIKQMDLSTINDIAGRLQYLEFLRNQIILSMNYNPSRLGLQGPTVPVTNNQQNIIQSSYQTNDVFAIHNKIVENLLNALVDVTKDALRENEDIASFVLDDLSIAELNLNWELLDLSEINVKIKNSSQEYQNVQEIKMLMQPLVQNGMLSLGDLIRISFAKSASEILNYAEQAQEYTEKKQQEQMQAQEEMLARQEQLQMQLAQMQIDAELEKEDRRGELEILKATIESSRFKQQKDVDANQVNDDITKETIKQQFEAEKQRKDQLSNERENDKNRKLERDKMMIDKELAEKKIAVDKIKARKTTPKK
jgi:hypothetical protein